ncbi:MAG TPA: hypothetical protein VGY91_00325 [Chthoniobacterales bacterium]|jgi:hypothetical protein|nr:hypothetical protein [Chthoniobacterales bacterium]
MTFEELNDLAAPEGFRPFAIVTQGGLRVEIPHPEFIDIPPEGASFVTVYRTSRSRIPRLIDLNAIDHIDHEVKP